MSTNESAPAKAEAEALPSPITDTLHAPVIFFEGIPNFGNHGGIVNLTLALGLHTANPTGGVDMRIAVAAYLRCTIAAAIDLRDSIDKALLIGAKYEGEAN